MNKKRFIVATVHVIVFILLFEWLFNEQIMKGLYASTADVWRAQAEIKMLTMMLAEIMLALVFCVLFLRACGPGPAGLSEGARFGALMGLVFAGMDLIFYAVLPIPFSMALFWVIGHLFEMVLAGMIMALIYKPV